MGSRRCGPNDLSRVISEMLKEYSTAVCEKVKQSTDEVSKQLVSDIRRDSPYKTKRYQRGWAVKPLFENQFGKRVLVCNKRSYQLTHLLEDSHQIVFRGGRVAGRTSPRPHIRPNEQKAEKELLERMKEDVKG